MTFASFCFFGFFPLAAYCLFGALKLSERDLFITSCLLTAVMLFVLGESPPARTPHPPQALPRHGAPSLYPSSPAAFLSPQPFSIPFVPPPPLLLPPPCTQARSSLR